MSLSSSIRAVMANDGPLAALVGTRIRPVILSPDDERPALTYRIVGNSLVMSQDGGCGDGECTLQVAVWSDDYDDRDEIGDTLNTALHVFDDISDGYHLTIFQQDNSDDTAEADLGDEFPIYANLHTFKVLYDKLG